MLDAQLGALVSVVSLVVGVFTIPLSLIAPIAQGRVRSITVMAFIWCLGTVACGLATNYWQLLAARAVVGLGEAAYAAAGAALLAHTFAPARRAAVQGAFQSAGLFGSVLGVMIGGTVAAHTWVWRALFFAVGTPGFVLAAIYPFVVRDYVAPQLSRSSPAARMRGAALPAREVVDAGVSPRPVRQPHLPRVRPADGHAGDPHRLDAHLPQPVLRSRPAEGRADGGRGGSRRRRGPG